MAKIVLIEDDSFLIRVYKVKLEHAGYESILIEKEAIREAVSIVKNNMPSVIILDIIMPQENGFEILKKLKKNPETEKIPVIVLTNLGQDADKNLGISMGAQEYLDKSSLSFSQVVEYVKKYA